VTGVDWFPVGDQHAHDPAVLAADHDWPTMRAHLVEGHHWPEVNRYEQAVPVDLDEFHRADHDPARHAEALALMSAALGDVEMRRELRRELGLPDDEDDEP
jgi:hypothetical protein